MSSMLPRLSRGTAAPNDGGAVTGSGGTFPGVRAKGTGSGILAAPVHPGLSIFDGTLCRT